MSEERIGGRPTQERSVATRLALLDAAVACVAERGYAAATTTEVSERAGVSRGAQLHHFPSKAALMVSALEHLLTLRLAEARALVADLGPITLDEGIDLIWRLHQGSTFVAHVEMWVAARTDPVLAAAIIEVDRRFTEETRLMFVEHLGALGRIDPRVAEVLRDVVFAVMQAVAFQRLVPRGQRPASDYLDELKLWLRARVTEDTRR